jgi:hypothetical protein
MKQFQWKTYTLIAAMLVVSLAMSSCRSLTDDVTPPPAQLDPTLPPPTNTPPPAETQQQETETSPEDVQTDDGGIVTVQVLDQTGAALLDENLEIILEGYDQFDQVYEDLLTIPSSGQVTFQGVPFQAERVFFVSVPYGGAVYRSEILQVDGEMEELNLQVQIFETTTDSSGLMIDRLHVLVEFPQPDLVQIVEIYILSNLGSATIVAESPDLPSVVFSLPEGAGSIQFENGALGQRYLLTDEGFGDTVSIPPGTGVYQVLVSYTLPYGRNRVDFEQRMDFPLDAAIVMVPPEGVTLKDGNLEDLGLQSLPGDQVRVYSTSGIAKGETLAFRISGRPGDPGSGLFSELDINQVIIYGVGIAGGLLLSVGIWLYIRNRGKDSRSDRPILNQEPREEILDSIIALEDLHHKGEISRETFEQKRDQLKDQLRNASGGEEP